MDSGFFKFKARCENPETSSFHPKILKIGIGQDTLPSDPEQTTVRGSPSILQLHSPQLYQHQSPPTYSYLLKSLSYFLLLYLVLFLIFLSRTFQLLILSFFPCQTQSLRGYKFSPKYHFNRIAHVLISSVFITFSVSNMFSLPSTYLLLPTNHLEMNFY